MPTPRSDRSTGQNVASQARRAAPGLLGGSRAGLGPVRKGLGENTSSTGAGNQEVFVETYDEDVSFARGYPHITFDPEGTFTPAP